MKEFVATFKTKDDVYACRKFVAPSLKEAVSQWVRTQEPTSTLNSIQQTK